MRYGFTTGSCAAAAAKAATYMLLSGHEKNQIMIETPKGILFEANVCDIQRSESFVRCSVEKDGGDDPDVTTGLMIAATVSLYEGKNEILIDGGEGVGRVTKPGLDQPVGNAAINSVPRAMIRKEVKEVMDLLDYQGAIFVCISVEGGEETAKKTFNPRLGIEGGISILGTSGIVEPMSEQALVDTIHVELRQRKVLGIDPLLIAPGNYGQDFMRTQYGYDLELSVKCSNFIGRTMDMVRELEFQKLLLTGHIGKLIKVAGGIMNTHSKEADCRMEIMTANAAICGVPGEVLSQVMEAVTTEEGIRILKEYDEDICNRVMEMILEKILFYLRKRVGEGTQVEVILFSNDFGLLAKSAGAEEIMKQACERLGKGEETDE